MLTQILSLLDMEENLIIWWMDSEFQVLKKKKGWGRVLWETSDVIDARLLIIQCCS